MAGRSVYTKFGAKPGDGRALSHAVVGKAEEDQLKLKAAATALFMGTAHHAAAEPAHAAPAAPAKAPRPARSEARNVALHNKLEDRADVAARKGDMSAAHAARVRFIGARAMMPREHVEAAVRQRAAANLAANPKGETRSPTALHESMRSHGLGGTNGHSFDVAREGSSFAVRHSYPGSSHGELIGPSFASHKEAARHLSEARASRKAEIKAAGKAAKEEARAEHAAKGAKAHGGGKGHAAASGGHASGHSGPGAIGHMLLKPLHAIAHLAPEVITRGVGLATTLGGVG